VTVTINSALFASAKIKHEYPWKRCSKCNLPSLDTHGNFQKKQRGMQTAEYYYSAILFFL